MYMFKTFYIGGEYDHVGAKGGAEVHVKAGSLVLDASQLHTLTSRVAYWRKANAIHKWFVENVQDGEDDCDDHEVSKEQMQSLLDTINEVMDDHGLAQDLLPTEDGFFFGGTEYDQYYFEDLAYTKEVLEKAISELENRKDCPFSFWFVYSSSW